MSVVQRLEELVEQRIGALVPRVEGNGDLLRWRGERHHGYGSLEMVYAIVPTRERHAIYRMSYTHHGCQNGSIYFQCCAGTLVPVHIRLKLAIHFFSLKALTSLAYCVQCVEGTYARLPSGMVVGIGFE